MENSKIVRNKQLNIRISELEKKVIKDKAELLGISVTDYIIECCIYTSTTEKFMSRLYCIDSIKAKNKGN